MAQIRKDKLTTNYYYHIYNRSIAGFTIFNKKAEYKRMLQLISLYCLKNFSYSYSYFMNRTKKEQHKILKSIKLDEKIVSIISFCLMPTHIHLILKQNTDSGISIFMSKILNSYARYFNSAHKRNGPLWAGRFKNVLIRTDEQLLHLTRYIHLNPTSAGLMEKPEQWDYSSYKEYLGQATKTNICEKENLFDFTPKAYKKFTENRKEYQRELSKIKSFLIDNCNG